MNTSRTERGAADATARGSSNLRLCVAWGRRRQLRAGLWAPLLLVASTALSPALAQWFDPLFGDERPLRLGRPGYDRPLEYGPGRGESPYNVPPPVFRGNERPLSPGLLVVRLEEQGYAEIGRPRYNGQVYEIDATSPRGVRVRLVFDAFRGTFMERFAIGRVPPTARAQEPRGWFGNNVRPPEASLGRRFDHRAEEDDDETFESLSRPGRQGPRLAPPARIDAAPLDSPPAGGTRGSEGRGRGPSQSAGVPRDVPPPAALEHTPVKPEGAARPDTAPRPDIASRPETAAPAGRVEGTNPGGGAGAGAGPTTGRPATRPTRTERAAIPENNRQADPAKPETKRDATPSEPRPRNAAKPATPLLTPPAEPVPSASKPAEKSAPVVAETPDTPRTDRPVRVIGGVTPLNPDAPPEPKP